MPFIWNLIIIIMVICKCYFFREHIALSILMESSTIKSLLDRNRRYGKCGNYLQRGTHVKQLRWGDDSKYSYCGEKTIFIGINLYWVLVAILQGVISSASNMVNMLYSIPRYSQVLRSFPSRESRKSANY